MKARSECSSRTATIRAMHTTLRAASFLGHSAIRSMQRSHYVHMNLQVALATTPNAATSIFATLALLVRNCRSSLCDFFWHPPLDVHKLTLSPRRTGEKLLVQLGTANPGKTAEEKQKWNDGLRGVLKELRTKNIKDPNGIAAEIARYRRQFLNDDTRVVNL